MTHNLQKALLEEINLVLDPVVLAAQSDLRRQQLFESLGWDLDAITGLPIDQLDERLSQFVTAYQSLMNLVENPPETISGFQEALNTVRHLFEAIRQLATVMDRPGVVAPPQFDQLGRDLITFLVAFYLRKWHPALYHLAVLLTLLRPAEQTPLEEIPVPVIDASSGRLLRSTLPRAQLKFHRLGELLKDPAGLLKNEYLSNDLATVEDAIQAAHKLFPRLSLFLGALGANCLYEIEPDYAFDFGDLREKIAGGLLTIYMHPDILDSRSLELSLGLSPTDHGDLGLVVVPVGDHEFTKLLGSWEVAFQLTAGVPAFALGRRGLTILGGPEGTSIKGQLTATKLPEAEDVAFLLGSVQGTHLEIGQFIITGELELSADKQDYRMLIEAGSTALVVAAGDGDSFLREVLPPGGLRTDFDLALGWSNRTGFYFRGSAGLEATLLVQASLLGVLSVDAVHLAIRTEGADLRTAVAATARFRLGPVEAVVEGVGLEVTFAFPQDGGNLGPVDLALNFKPPDGVGLVIDAGALVGGGYLFFDPVQEQYAGAVQLEFNGITLQGVGLITTRLPGGASGFSMLIILTAEGFTPINLGLGFTLNGVGGLLAVNRTVAVEPLRHGLKQRALDAVLFPKDPVGNAPQIISNLRQIFPPKRDQFAFGPTALIGWGTPTVLTIELALVLEFPSPFRLIALGQLRVLLPSTDKPLVRLHMDALGVVDFDRGELALDATLYDSRILHYIVSGDMALRVRWNNDPTFLLAVGGFHPRFQPPPGFPTLDRIAVSLTRGNNPRLRLTAYLALTSNTAQIGAHLDLYMAVAGVSIEGYLGFDTLFQFAPFQFVVDLGAGVTLKWRGRTLLGVYLEMTLSGPAPWHARGKAKIKVFLFSVSISFDKTFGDAAPATLPPVDPLPELLQALGERRNWSAQLPPTGATLVTLREIPATDEVLVHPLGRLSIQQHILPLNVEIGRFGNTTPSGDRRFTITQVAIGGRPVGERKPTMAFFARAQFIVMSDAQKLTAPSFEKMESGVEIGVASVTYGGQTDSNLMVTTDMEYEECIIGDEADIRATRPYDVTPDTLAAVASISAAGRSPMRHTGREKYRAPALGVAFAAETYVVARTTDLAAVAIPELDGAVQGVTYTAASDALARHLARHPEVRDQLQIVAHSEAKGGVA